MIKTIRNRNDVKRRHQSVQIHENKENRCFKFPNLFLFVIDTVWLHDIRSEAFFLKWHFLTFVFQINNRCYWDTWFYLLFVYLLVWSFDCLFVDGLLLLVLFSVIERKLFIDLILLIEIVHCYNFFCRQEMLIKWYVCLLLLGDNLNNLYWVDKIYYIYYCFCFWKVIFCFWINILFWNWNLICRLLFLMMIVLLIVVVVSTIEFVNEMITEVVD